jgi:predicted acetyltransferase
LVYVNEQIAGFVLVSKMVFLPENKGANAIAEFFVMRKYRRLGVGKEVAFRIFDLFPGKWEVQETKRNIPAQKFWSKVIAEYTNGRFSESRPADKPFIGAIQSFDNSDWVKE